MFFVLTIIYLSQQASYFSREGGSRTVDHVKIGAWVVLSAVLLLAISTKGFWFKRRELRNLLDDENTQANRGSAMKWGFLTAMLISFALYFVDQFEPMQARDAIHLIVSGGLAAALIRFGVLERRAHASA